MRDTASVFGDSWLVVRFLADHPGVFLFHCHLEWHVEMGLTTTFIVGPQALRDITLPDDHIEACVALGMPSAGNAGGSLDDPLDTSNYDLFPPEEYIG
jgi:iron transport multicopper oxidase